MSFRHIGGAVIADHGMVSLASAESLAHFYAEEAAFHAKAARPDLARLCAGRANALRRAADETRRWRRAAGWSDPDTLEAGMSD